MTKPRLSMLTAVGIIALQVLALVAFMLWGCTRAMPFAAGR